MVIHMKLSPPLSEYSNYLSFVYNSLACLFTLNKSVEYLFEPTEYDVVARITETVTVFTTFDFFPIIKISVKHY